MKNKIGTEILGIWRYSSDEYKIDFAIRDWDENSKHKSIFTKINDQDSKIEYHWKAFKDIVERKGEWAIELSELFTEGSNHHKYLNLSIVQKDFEKWCLVIKADGGERIVFDKIG